MLLYKLQQSLEKKMADEGTLTQTTKFKNRKQEEVEADKWLKEQMQKL